MKTENIHFRTDIITATRLKEKAEKHKLTMSAFINFIIDDYEKLKRKIGSEENTEYMKNTLDKIFELLEVNNSLSRNFQNTERANLEKQIENLNNQIGKLKNSLKEKTEEADKYYKNYNTVGDYFLSCRNLVYAIISRYKFSYDDVLNTYLNDEYCKTQDNRKERQLFLEKRIKPKFPERKKGFF